MSSGRRSPAALLLCLPPALCFFQPPPAPATPDSASVHASVAIRLRVEAPERVSVPAGSLRAGSTASELARAASRCARGGTPDLRVLCRAMLQLERTPPRRVRLSAFRIDRLEITQAAYARCLRAGACTPTHDGPAAQRGARLPVVAVDHAQARSYCRFVGGALPTEAQWERAARAEGSDPFPWGQVDNASLSNHGRLR
ncbi:MAG: formylglycine-generating enzyme family protein, partial [Deltaproteobacteria bacterium]|nr:formylglycine-generating enzyme family protein [Deltaproteobacteria bacterium]